METDYKQSKIVGPIFISIGDTEKLNVFLDKNPYVPRDMAFVDDDMKGFSAYKKAGFGRFDEIDPAVARQVKLQAPAGINWMTYLGSVMKVSPVPKDQKLFGGGLPEGVLRLGGTFVVKGDEILYRWADRLPGDHPNIEEVWKIASDATVMS
jgi:hypothetical protein